ncbi:MAG: TIGR03545 family protein [Elusimicrobia bacterium]|nr:TIGR03545 family protein [Elusimicrobiota bacterium]
MRYSYVIPRLILLLLIWAFFFFAFDPLLKWGITKSLETAAEAKVDIAKLKTKFLKPSLYIAGVQVGDSQDEYKNIVEFSELRFEIETKPLLEKKFVINEASLKGLKFATRRKTSAKIRKKKTKTPEFMAKLQDEAKSLATEKFSDIKTGAVEDVEVKTDSLESVKLARELEEKYQKIYDEIKKTADSDKYEKGIDGIEKRYETAKTESNFLKQTKEYGKLADEIKALAEEFKKDKKTAETAMDSLKTDIKLIDEARKKDTDGLMAKMKMPSLDAKGISKMLAGPAVYSKIEKARHWLVLAKKYMPESAKSKALKDEFKRGRIVHFPKTDSWPSFLLKKAMITGEISLDEYSPLEYSGSALGITTQPKIYGKPAYAVLSGRQQKTRFDFKAEFDNTREILKSKLKLECAGISMKTFKMGSDKSFGLTVSNGAGDFNGDFRIEGDKISGDSIFSVSGAEIHPELESVKFSPLKNALSNSFSTIKNFNVRIGLSGKLDSPDIDIDTSLSQDVSRAFKTALGGEIEKAKEKARAQVDKALKPYTDKLDGLKKSKEEEIKKLLKSNEDKIEKFKNGFLQKLKPDSKIKLPKIKF